MINKVWFWLAIIGFVTAVSVDVYEIFAIPKQISSQLIEDPQQEIVEEDMTNPLVVRTRRKGAITTEDCQFSAGDDLYTIQEEIKDRAPFLQVSIEEYEAPDLKDDGYFEGIRNSIITQYKGEEEGNYFLLLDIHPDYKAEYGRAREINFQKPIEGLGIAERNAVFNEEFTPFGSLQYVVDEIMNYSGEAVELAIGLIGIMALWLGLMKIAEEAGMIQILARLIKPLTRILFPDIPPEHPAVGAMLMNISANMLGLGNAATPLGLKAMEELQKINKDKKTASNAMVMFLVLNTSGLALIPTTVLGIRIAAGAADPFGIIGPVILATGTATIVGVIAAKVLQRFSPDPSAGDNQTKKEEK